MKKYLNTFILIGVLLILVAGVIGVRYYKERKNTLPQANNFYNNLKIEDLTKIEIIKADKTVVLQKENDKWLEIKSEAEKPEADATSVASILDKTRDLKAGEPITEKTDKQELFQVNASGMQVKMYQGENIIVNFFVGKSTPDYNGNYIRKDGENGIYATSERIASYFSKSTFVKN